MRLIGFMGLALLCACQGGGDIQNESEPAQTQPETSSANTAAVEAAASDPVADCVERGITYLKEIESYPTLKSAPNVGRLAAEVASERCNRTTTAFP
jgi:hypothetical protein